MNHPRLTRHLSFGDPKAQPQTPRQTPTTTSVAFPSPIFDTPKPYQGSFAEPGGLTPRFAEEYSVFNSTPGNLRGSQGHFPDFVPPPTYTRGHKRLLSADGSLVDLPPHANHLSANPDKFDSPRQLPLSPPAPTPSSVAAAAAPTQLSPDLVRSTSLKKSRKQSDADQQLQVLSPPPSSNKGGRKLAPKLNMLTNQAFCHPPDHLVDHDMSVLMGNSADLYGYPVSAPAVASSNFWDPSVTLPMDIDFNAHAAGVMHPSSHRHTGSFDWNADITMFQDVSAPAPLVSHDDAQQQQQQHQQQPRQERMLAPKPSNPVPLDDPFGIMHPGGAVDPGLLIGRPHTSALDSGFGPLSRPRLAERMAPSFGGNALGGGELRRVNSAQGPPRTSARLMTTTDHLSAVGSPVKPNNARPGLGRSCSENRGRRAAGGRKTCPAAPPVEGVRFGPETNFVGAGHAVSKGCWPAPSRPSPTKTVPRVMSLASIPETSPQRRPRTSVRLTIDSRGRARAETTVIGEGGQAPPPPSSSSSFSDKHLHRSNSAREVATGNREWDSTDDESTDDEPIIIPSRNGSFNASYALPDPCKPVGSIFHASCRSVRSNSAESEAETVVHDGQHKGGDAMRELRRVVEDRQKRSRRMAGGRPQALIPPAMTTATNLASYPGGIISPTSLTGSSHGGNGVRCVCDDTSADEADGFMLQCQSCEMWLHGKCINVTRRSVPRVYICCYCADTPKTGRRCRESGLGIAASPSPLANRSWIKVLKTLERLRPAVGKFVFHEHLLGGASIDAHGTALTDEALSAAKTADGVLLGAIGGPKWGTGSVRPEQGILRLRKELGTYGNLRPCFFASPSLVDASPLKAEICRGTDLVIVRELTGGLYFGDRKEDDGSGEAYDVEPYSRPEIERVARLAGFLARGRGDKVVWSLDKANVLATSRLWRKVVTETFEREFSDLRVEHQLIDSAAMLLVKSPTKLNGVVVMNNLFGDIISDQVSAIPGSIGLLPSASVGGIPDGKTRCNGIYEPIHGSAPDISGKGIVNPIGMILSVAMLLRYSLNLPSEAKAIEDAVRQALDAGLRTQDLGGKATTKEAGDEIVNRLASVLKNM
ncbi:hypothetical protein CP533_3814 [Ophiocordyceps camponoti-saundersi (nom. inval.)]|nr:hypothetical protein CP533_3814 [Ophiocordyceps camponoti-saundersi (nom. inval.)]